MLLYDDEALQAHEVNSFCKTEACKTCITLSFSQSDFSRSLCLPLCLSNTYQNADTLSTSGMLNKGRYMYCGTGKSGQIT